MIAFARAIRPGAYRTRGLVEAGNRAASAKNRFAI